GDFHGFLAGWSYWVYTVFYFPALLTASVAMSVYIAGPKYAWLAKNNTYLIGASLAMLAVAVGMNIVGLNIGKWLQNAGGVGTYAPLLILVGVAAAIWVRHGSQTHITWHSTLPVWNFGTVNFWSQIAFAFTGMELVCAMADEVRDPKRTFPRAIFASGVLIAIIYILGTVATMGLVAPNEVDHKSGVFEAIAHGSSLVGLGFLGVLAAL